MPVSTLKPEVEDNLDVWQMMRDVIGGSRPVKAAGTKYLPMLSKMTQTDYQNYKMRADFFDGTSRASQAMLGFLFRKPPQVNVPKQNTDLEEFQSDATLTGKSLYDLTKDCSQETVDIGRCGVWVDWNEEEDRPYAILYLAHDVINWAYTRRQGKMVLSHLILHERVQVENAKDKYQEAYVDQWREFVLSEQNEVTITIWQKKKTRQDEPTGAPGNVVGNALTGTMKYLFGTGTSPAAGGEAQDYTSIETRTPTRSGAPLNRILFTFFGTDGPYPEICKPPLYGMADLNLSWYRTSADLENARHYVGVPTPYACGFTEGGKPAELTMGSSRVWVTSEVAAHCGFLQIADNFTSLSSGLAEKKAGMAELGVQLIDSPGADKSPEAYATVALRVSAQSSGLTAISRALTQCLTDVLTNAAWYAGTAATPEELSEDINVKMNLDFMAEQIQSADFTALVSAYIQGVISYETLFYNLQAGEIIEDGVTMEEEIARIKSGRQMLLAEPTAPAGSPQLAEGERGAAPIARRQGPPPPKQSSV
jgi:hypothetical protein